MPAKLNVKLLLYLTSMSAPYIFTSFFKNEVGFGIGIPIFFLSFIFLVISSLALRDKTAAPPLRKWSPVLGGFLAVLLFFPSFGLQCKVSNYVFFKRHESQLKQFVSEIKNYKKIRQMTDGQGVWGIVNYESTKPGREIIDTTNESGEKKFLYDIFQRDEINKGQYEAFRQQLLKTGFVSFARLEDGTLSFTIGGLIDNCYGFAYSETGGHPINNDCGEIIFWQQVANQWYAWGTT